MIDRRNLKDSADDFIQGKQDKMNLNSSEKISNQSEYLKQQFLKRKENLSSYLPPEKDDSKDKFSKLGSFKTNVGSVSVGFQKFKSNSKLRFTLLSDKEKDFDEKSSKLDFKDDRNYFKKSFDKGNDEYQENSTTLEFNPKDKSLRKINEIFSDDINTDDDEILYDDELEESEIENIKNKSKSINPNVANDAISDLKVIKNEKQEDNKKFKHDIQEFSKLFGKNKLKKFEDSDQIKVAQQRLSSKNIDYLLNKRMKEFFNLREKFYLIIKLILVKKIKNLQKKGVE